VNEARGNQRAAAIRQHLACRSLEFGEPTTWGVQMRTTISFPIAVASLCLSTAAFAADQSTEWSTNQPTVKTREQPTGQPETAIVEVKQLPAPAQATLAREADHVETVQEYTHNGSTVYQATVAKRGKNYRLEIAKDGTLVNRQPVGTTQ
jgi:hypothetical protein